MRLIKTLQDQLGFVWVCPVCFTAKRLTNSTPLAGINLQLIDYALSMWVRNATPKISGRCSSNPTNLHKLFTIFRKSHRYYY